MIEVAQRRKFRDQHFHIAIHRVEKQNKKVRRVHSTNRLIPFPLASPSRSSLHDPLLSFDQEALLHQSSSMLKHKKVPSPMANRSYWGGKGKSRRKLFNISTSTIVTPCSKRRECSSRILKSQVRCSRACLFEDFETK